jgi:hypothetical protein
MDLVHLEKGCLIFDVLIFDGDFASMIDLLNRFRMLNRSDV